MLRPKPLAMLATLVVAVMAMVLTLRPSNDLPDFRQYEAGAARKSAFFEYLRPIVERANAEVLRDRERLLDIATSEAPDPGALRWLRRTAARYELAYEAARPREVIDALLRRLDAVPESLALAQAAKESGWGTSRFAREGNNLFGEWCFSPGCGIVPSRRAAGRTHEVRRFDSPRAAVESYLMTLNTHPAYHELRAMRAQLRSIGRDLSGLRLAGGLSRYSERGTAYVDDVRALIRFNDLE